MISLQDRKLVVKVLDKYGSSGRFADKFGYPFTRMEVAMAVKTLKSKGHLIEDSQDIGIIRDFIIYLRAKHQYEKKLRQLPKRYIS